MSSPTSPAQAPLQRLGQRSSVISYIQQVWRRRQFAFAIAGGELRAQNMDTVLGNLWHVLNPLLLALIYYLIFGVLLDITRGTISNVAGFIVVGVFVFHYSQKTIMSGAKSISDNEGLIRSIRFPRALLPLSVVLGQAVAILPALGVMLLVVTATGERPQWAWALMPALLVVQTVFNVGASFVVARFADRYRDVQQVLPYAFRLLFYASGVLYPVTRFISDDSPLRWLFDLNPFYIWVSLWRGPLMPSEAEVPTFDPSLAAVGVVWALIMLVGGFLYFRAGEASYGRG